LQGCDIRNTEFCGKRFAARAIVAADDCDYVSITEITAADMFDKQTGNSSAADDGNTHAGTIYEGMPIVPQP
jgi:hypothetical protein